MNKLILNCPINSLSLGNVSVNLLREIWKRNIPTGIFPIGNSVSLEAFDKLSSDFRTWVEQAINNRFYFLDQNAPSIKIWHINGSEERVSDSQYLFSFYELDEPTFVERKIVNSQENAIFSSSHAASCFSQANCDKVEFVPLGLDEDFYPTKRNYLEDVIHFGLIGKFEKRKHTAKLLNAWANKYGNKKGYQLTCCITNPFFQPEQMNGVIAHALNGVQYWNINFLPYLKTNLEINELTNSIDIDLSGMSGGEGWGLPSFNATALGKWSLVLNHSSHKDWATETNSVLVQPDGKEEAYDGQFFIKGQPFNQGHIANFSEENLNNALDKAVDLVKNGVINQEGLELKNEFNYSLTLDKILNIINKNE